MASNIAKAKLLQFSTLESVASWWDEGIELSLQKLLASNNRALLFMVSRDLLGREEDTSLRKEVWELPEVLRLIQKQLPNGAWKYPNPKEYLRSQENYNQLESYRILRILIEKYALNKFHKAIQKAAKYFFSCQTEEGDFRGIAGNQYMPYYSAGIMELLIKAGFAQDPRIEKGMRWLLSIRQQDGGWAFPLRTVGRKLSAETFDAKPLLPDTSKPFSHLVTGVVLRAFAAHPGYRKSWEASKAGSLLASSFFKADSYSDRRAPSFWTHFSYPFWFTDLLSSLDSLSSILPKGADEDIVAGLKWFAERRGADGLWRLATRIMVREPDRDLWISYAVSRVFARFSAR